VDAKEGKDEEENEEESKKAIKLTESQPTLRVSTRSRVPPKQFKYVNCHCCNGLDLIENLLSCKNELCKENFCLRCLGKYDVKILYDIIE
jgi:hypothetical protein